MSRTLPLSLALMLVVGLGCAERPTGPPDALTTTRAGRALARDPLPLGTTQWQSTARALVKARSVSPIAAARAYGLASLAQYAAVASVDGSDNRQVNGLGADALRGAIAAASVKLLSYLFPADVASLQAQLETEALAGTPAQQAAFAVGRAAGAPVGDLIVARGRADGFAQANGSPQVWDPTTLRTGPDVWSMDADAVPQVPAGFQFAGIRPYFLDNAAQFRAPPPSDVGPQLAEVVAIVASRTPEQAALAVALNQSSGTITTAGAFAEVAATFIEQRNLDDRAAAHVYALLHAAIMDAVIGCWDSKFEYLVRRPWQVAPQQLPRTVLLIGRPNHPSYPSGHSCVSAAAAAVLERFFPEQRAVLEQQVEDNGMSRIYAGIHYRMDVEAGQELGRAVAGWAIRYDNRNSLLAAVLPGYRGNDDR